MIIIIIIIITMTKNENVPFPCKYDQKHINPIFCSMKS